MLKDWEEKSVKILLGDEKAKMIESGQNELDINQEMPKRNAIPRNNEGDTIFEVTSLVYEVIYPVYAALFAVAEKVKSEPPVFENVNLPAPSKAPFNSTVFGEKFLI